MPSNWVPHGPGGSDTDRTGLKKKRCEPHLKRNTYPLKVLVCHYNLNRSKIQHLSLITVSWPEIIEMGIITLVVELIVGILEYLNAHTVGTKK
jgi:hypothetical protein